MDSKIGKVSLFYKAKEFLGGFYPVRILDKYVFLDFFKVFLGTLVMLTTMILVYEITNQLKYFVESKETASYAYQYILFSIPSMVFQVVAPSLMFSVCFTIGQLNAGKELVAMMVAGVSFFRIVFPILAFGLLIWILMIFFTQFAVIPGNKIAQKNQSYMIRGAGRLTDLVYQFHVKGKEGFYYVYWYDEKESSIKGGFNYIRILPEGLPDYVVSAEKAIYRKESNDWLLTNVEELVFNKNLEIEKIQKFSEKVYNFPESIDYFSKPIRNPEGLNFWELGEEMEIRKAKGVPYLDLIVQRHEQLAMPFMCFVVVFIGSLAGAITKKSAGVASLGITIAVVLFYYIFYSTMKSLSENGAIPVWLGVWLTPFLFLTAGYFSYKKLNL